MPVAPRHIALAALLGLTVAGCARKPRDLPPPPPPPAPVQPAPAAQPAPPPASQAGGVTTTAVPGSEADFRETSGSDRVLFALDSYELDEAARDTLGRQAGWLAKYPQVRVTIEGHADERGTREYNLALGERRATAARNFLTAQGVDSGRITIISYGKERPAVEGSSEEAWAQNRRAVTVITGGAAR